MRRSKSVRGKSPVQRSMLQAGRTTPGESNRVGRVVMEKGMPTRIGSIAPAMFAALLLASAVPLLPSHAARAAAADDCLAAPKSQAPQGRHWYYRVDRVNGRKCWYLGVAGTKTRQAAPQEAQAAPHAQKPVRPLPPVGRETAGDVLPPAQIEPSSKGTAPASIAEATPQGAASAMQWLTPPQPAAAMEREPADTPVVDARVATDTQATDAPDAALDVSPHRRRAGDQRHCCAIQDRRGATTTYSHRRIQDGAARAPCARTHSSAFRQPGC